MRWTLLIVLFSLTAATFVSRADSSPLSSPLDGMAWDDNTVVLCGRWSDNRPDNMLTVSSLKETKTVNLNTLIEKSDLLCGALPDSLLPRVAGEFREIFLSTHELAGAEKLFVTVSNVSIGRRPTSSSGPIQLLPQEDPDGIHPASDRFRITRGESGQLNVS